MIPTLVQSSIRVYTKCSAVVADSISGEVSSAFLRAPPNIRDVFRLIEGCATLPKESAENKKLFTRYVCYVRIS